MSDTTHKKALALGMHERGLRCEAIAELLHTTPSVVANILIEADQQPSFKDVYHRAKSQDCPQCRETKAQCDELLAACEAVAAKSGQCIYGCLELADDADPRQAYRLGSAHAFEQCGALVAEAIAKAKGEG